MSPPASPPPPLPVLLLGSATPGSCTNVYKTGESRLLWLEWRSRGLRAAFAWLFPPSLPPKLLRVEFDNNYVDEP